jgi:hypothetical protein
VAAEHFAGMPGVVGYDMINEPYGEAQILTDLYEEIAKNIRSQDPDGILFLSPSLYLWLVSPFATLPLISMTNRSNSINANNCNHPRSSS